MSHELLSNFGDHLNIAVIGASGGLGRAFVEHCVAQPNVSSIHAFSRSRAEFKSEKIKKHEIDITSEASIQKAIASAGSALLFDAVIVATGILHNESVSPEKSIRELNFEKFHKVFLVNTYGPALIAKYFLPNLQRDRKSVFACLSARVGSIGDNRLGGWYAYRASKTALNMTLKNAAIEIARRHEQICIIGLHPGTVDTPLSRPFQRHVEKGKLFTPEYSAACMLTVINNVTSKQSGKVFAWDGKEVPS